MIVCDPMLATGGSASDAIQMLKDKGVPTLSNSKIFKLQLRLAAAKAKEQK